VKVKGPLVKSYGYPDAVWLTYFHDRDELAHRRPDVDPHRHLYYELLFFKEAQGITHYLDANPFEVAPGSLFFIAPRQVHFFTRAGKACKFQVYAITFSDDFLAHVTGEAGYKDIINDLLQQDGFMSISNKDNTVEKIWGDIHNEIEGKQFGYQKQVLNLFRNLLIYLKRQLIYKNNLPPTYGSHHLFSHFQQLVEKYCTEQWSIQHYATAMNITTRQLNRICSMQKGCSPLQFIHEQLNIEAKRNLYHSGLQVKEIAKILGFSDQAYFSRFFTRMNKKSPGAFKKSIVQKHN
jgi:AraC family transcriptional regulator, transcriptional activator of pobA